ncbi:uncharacterized protein GGS25DRAFT_520743 [Hypoxylon fragiforme]|uniref:uncharacterized protein n=1 Tax=Hypoxylon fragiforme TaxID=63214 RepID=UPI0020C66EA5|nr:uncharacterized protein GGS25DRAFT_520743 [Hypoxylon fragiforme]KAI2609938.1 hypothetical protein GGS25DRAFT_520743 [Hypoxylon fragiforme]
MNPPYAPLPQAHPGDNFLPKSKTIAELKAKINSHGWSDTPENRHEFMRSFDTAPRNDMGYYHLSRLIDLIDMIVFHRLFKGRFGILLTLVKEDWAPRAGEPWAATRIQVQQPWPSSVIWMCGSIDRVTMQVRVEMTRRTQMTVLVHEMAHAYISTFWRENAADRANIQTNHYHGECFWYVFKRACGILEHIHPELFGMAIGGPAFLQNLDAPGNLDGLGMGPPFPDEPPSPPEPPTIINPSPDGSPNPSPDPSPDPSPPRSDSSGSTATTAILVGPVAGGAGPVAAPEPEPAPEWAADRALLLARMERQRYRRMTGALLLILVVLAFLTRGQ